MKLITVPLTQEAMIALDTDTALPEALHEVELTPAMFDALWRAGVFAKISAQTGVFIGDYEDAILTGDETLGTVVRALDGFALTGEAAAGAALLRQQAMLAQDRATGLFLFF